MHRCTDLRHLYGLDFMTFLLFSYGVFQGTVTKENCCSLGNMQYTSVHHSIPFQCIPLRHMNLQTKSSELLKSCLDLHLLEESTEHSTIGNNMEHPSDPVWSPSRNSSSSFCIPKGAKHGKILHVHLQTKVFNIAMLRSREQQEILESSNPFRSRVLILIIYFIYIYIYFNFCSIFCEAWVVKSLQPWWSAAIPDWKIVKGPQRPKLQQDQPQASRSDHSFRER